jgi:hypothetical protein
MKKEGRDSVLGAPDCPVRPLTVGPASPGCSASAPKETREQRVAKLNFSRHTGLFSVHRTLIIHCLVCHHPNG